MPVLIVITQPDECEHESEIINSLFNAGLQHLHVRKPDWTKEKMKVLIKHIHISNLNKITIHSHFDLAEEFPLKGIHLTSHYLKAHTESEIRGQIQIAQNKNLSVSSSTHSLEEIKNIKYNFDYIFISPVFKSISKKDYTSSINLTELKKITFSNTSTCKIIALGGIIENNIKAVIETGVNGAAVLGAIWMEENKIDKFKILKKFVDL